MYRKYNLTKTNVLNTYNYLLETREIKTGSIGLFHQVLANEGLPTLMQENAVQAVISQSQNQNIINEVEGKFQLYMDQNLIQIRIKPDVKLLSQIYSLTNVEIIKLINAFNLDCLLSVKQLISNTMHNEVHLNNVNKFFSYFVCKEEWKDHVIPFFQQSKIHYYDLTYNQFFNKNTNRKNEDKLKKNQQKLKSKLNHKFQKKTPKIERQFYNQRQIFKRYLQFIILFMSNPSYLQLNKELKENMVYNKEEYIKKIQIIKDNMCQKIERGFAQLLFQCLKYEDQYNLNIFNKQCQILQEKYESFGTLGDNVIEKELQDKRQNQFFNCRRSQDYTKSQEKLKISKSCLILNKTQTHNISRSKDTHKLNQKKLKSSKSEISLKQSANNSMLSAKNRRFKNGSRIFERSKQRLNNSKIFNEDTVLKESKSSSKTSSFGITNKSFLKNLSSAASNWFNQSSCDNTQTMSKLRNFKRGNISNTGVNSPIGHVNTKMEQSHKFHQQQEVEQKIKEVNLNRFKKPIRRQNIQKKQLDEVVESFSKQDYLGQDQNSPQNNKQNNCHQSLSKPQQNRRFNANDQKDMASINQKDNESKYINQERTQIQVIKAQQNKSKVNRNSVSKKLKKVQAQTQPVKSFQNSSNKENYFEKKPSVINSNNRNVSEPKQDKSSKIELNNKYQKQINQKKIKQKFQDHDQFQEIEEVKFTKKNSTKLQTKKQQRKIQEINLKDQKQISSNPQNPSTKPAPTKRIIQSKNQNQLYIKHFQKMVIFIKQNNKKVSVLPQYNNLYYIVNLLYYKTMIENSQSQGYQKYKDLIGLLVKKQKKIPQDMKNNYLLFRVELYSLWSEAKVIQNLQKDISQNHQLYSHRQKDVEPIEIVSKFYTLSSQSVKILQQILNQTSAYIQTNKSFLIKQNLYITFLIFNYMIAQTIVITFQRQEYYKNIKDKQFSKLQNCFHFQYSENQEEYIKAYRRTLQEKNIIHINAQEELNYLKSWIQQYK